MRAVLPYFVRAVLPDYQVTSLMCLIVKIARLHLVNICLQRQNEVKRKTEHMALKGELVWPDGKAGKQRDLGSNLLWLSFLFQSCGWDTVL